MDTTFKRKDGKKINVEAIPKDVALQIYAEIRQENRRKRLSLAAVQCWGCFKFAKGNPAKMCIFSRLDNRGCNLVNKKYESQSDSSDA